MERPKIIHSMQLYTCSSSHEANEEEVKLNFIGHSLSRAQFGFKIHWMNFNLGESICTNP